MVDLLILSRAIEQPIALALGLIAVWCILRGKHDE